MTMRPRPASLLLLLLIVGLSTPALAQTATRSGGGGTSGLGWNGWGVRVGISDNPDQVYGGVHFDLGQFAKDVRFRPYIDLGSGDHATTMQAIAEVTYLFSKVQVWKPYVGGGAGFSYVHINNAPAGVDDSDTDVALMAVGGVETKLKSATKFFMELRAGLGDDDPDFKLGVGWTWK